MLCMKAKCCHTWFYMRPTSFHLNELNFILIQVAFELFKFVQRDLHYHMKVKLH